MTAGVDGRRVRAVLRRLRKAYGPFRPKPRLPVIDELIVTVLSQATSDVNRDRAFRALKERFPTWEEVLDAPADEVADAIRPGGIADVKARRIRAILAEIEEREGSLSLDRLHDMDDQEVDRYLCGLPGVGPKTAACVLVFSMGRAAFPIDTHVHRVATRLGWIEEASTADQAHRELSPRIPAAIRYDLHVALIDHGRATCTARRPCCRVCVLLDLCAAGPRFLEAGQAR